MSAPTQMSPPPPTSTANDASTSEPARHRPLRRAWHSTSRVVGAAIKAFGRNEGPRLAAALAFYTVLTFAPLLIIVVTVAGFIWGDAAAQGEVVSALETMAGPQAAEIASTVVRRAGEVDTSGLAGVLSFGFFLVSAGVLVVHLRKSLNELWDVEQTRTGLKNTLFNRVFGMGIVLALGGVLLAFVGASTLLNTLLGRLQDVIPGPPAMWYVASAGATLVVLIPLFAAVYKWIPNVRIAWGDVWFGATVTAVLFSVGKELIAWWLGRSARPEFYGAAASLLFTLMWVYYSAIAVFFGASLTRARAEHFGRRIRADGNSVRVKLVRLDAECEPETLEPSEADQTRAAR